MNYRPTRRFERSFKKFQAEVKNAFKKQISLLLKDLRHPSLRAKKYDESHDVWQARVTHNVRFYFVIDGNEYVLIDIEKHRD